MPDVEEALRAMFPTLWAGPEINDLDRQVSVTEVDLVIAGRSAVVGGHWADPHLICFSQSTPKLPGPTLGSFVYNSGLAETEEFILPQLPLALNRVRQMDLSNVNTTRDWIKIALFKQYIDKAENRSTTAEEVFASGTILLTTQGPAPLGVFDLRQKEKRGLAWLPNKAFDCLNWITVLTNLWAEADPQSFPTIGNWARSKAWMFGTELALLERISALEQEREEVTRSFDHLIDQETQALDVLSREIDHTRRRLISEQGDELVDEVASVLKELGFEVERVDEALLTGTPKREDLRLRVPTVNPQWEAIVEVRGYKRSGGATADLQRLERFAALYRQQKKREPDMKIYIINPQTELPPDQRDFFLRSASEDVEVFAEGGGLVISTLSLFQALKNISTENLAEIRQSIIDSRGAWAYSAIESPR